MYLLVNLSKAFGGAEIRVLQTVRGLAGKKDCGVVVLTGSMLHQRLTREKARVFPLSYHRADPRLAFAIGRLIQANGAKLIDSHNPQSHLWGMLGARLAGGTAIVATIHSTRDETISRVKSFVYESVLMLCYRAGAHFVAVSESVRDFVTGLGVPEANIAVIPNSLPLQGPITVKPHGTLRKSLGWSAKHFLIIIVGRLEPIKGHRFFIEALPDILRKYPQVRCLIVGSGRQEEELKKQVEKRGLGETVHFTGFRDDIEDLLRQSDLFCMPSLSEGLPFALLEACACNVPLLCSDVGGISELLDDGSTALLVSPGNPEALAEGVQRAIENPALMVEMADRALRVIKENFSISKTISSTRAIYDTLISLHADSSE